VRLPARNRDGSLNIFVETPRGSTAKFKYDERDGVIRLSRPLPAGLSYPYDWGFVPSMRAADGDALDAMILWDGTSYPGVIVSARGIGVLRVEQKNLETGARERNDRVMTVPVKAYHFDRDTLNPRLRAELEQFFLAAVAFEGKDVRLLGWGDADEADAVVRAAERSPLASGEQQQASVHRDGR
jgi:inorganic pyrophosphatase